MKGKLLYYYNDENEMITLGAISASELSESHESLIKNIIIEKVFGQYAEKSMRLINDIVHALIVNGYYFDEEVNYEYNVNDIDIYL